MTSPSTNTTESHGGMQTLIRRNLAKVVFDLILPMVVYYGLRAAGVGQWWSMMAGIFVALPWVVYLLIRQRKFDLMAVFTVSIMVFSIVIGLLTGDPRALAVREGWIGALLGLLGAWMLVTVLVGRPALLVLGRTIAETKTGEAGAAAWEKRWEYDQSFRRGIRVLTTVWGAVLLIDTGINISLIYLLPIDLISVVSNVQWWIVLAGVLGFHLYYTKKVDLRA